eukprot:3142703-Rhodomonas_salina.5
MCRMIFAWDERVDAVCLIAVSDISYGMLRIIGGSYPTSVPDISGEIRRMIGRVLICHSTGYFIENA